MPELRLITLTKTFRSREAPVLDRIDFTAPNGQCTAVLGPSGCGKTTLLRIVAGLEKQTSGSFVFGEEDCQGLSVRSRPDTHHVAMVFQTPALYRHMSARRNIEIGARQSSDASGGPQRVDAIVRSLDVAHVLDARPGRLSVGECQRVAIAKALASQPDLLLLDEPFSSLDPHRKHAAVQLVRALRDANEKNVRLPTTLLVTHDQHEALQLAHHMVVMRDGRVHQQGAPMQIYRQPATLFVARFIGNPGMNVLVGTVRTTENGSLVFANPRIAGQRVGIGVSGADRVSDQPVALCVRPADVRMVSERASPTPGRESPPVPGRVSLPATVGSVVELGDAIHVYCDLSCDLHQRMSTPVPIELSDDVLGTRTMSRWVVVLPASSRTVPEMGSSVALWFDTESCHVFSLNQPDQPRLRIVAAV